MDEKKYYLLTISLYADVFFVPVVRTMYVPGARVQRYDSFSSNRTPPTLRPQRS